MVGARLRVRVRVRDGVRGRVRLRLRLRVRIVARPLANARDYYALRLREHVQREQGVRSSVFIGQGQGTICASLA